MKDMPNCVKCGSTFTYHDGTTYVCPDCFHEWTEEAVVPGENHEVVVKDAYGNILRDGDSVSIIQDIKVKGSSSVIKVGVKVKGIRIVDAVNGHNIDAKVPGFGSMMLKSEIVKKCSE
jgi:protein PhnA